MILYAIFFLYWLLFWSFASVIIHRLKSWEKWILWWRSHCNNCNTKLKSYDLVPIFSWLSTFWKCRYCKTKISKIYPFLEIFTAVIFTMCAIFLVDINQIILWDFREILKLLFWIVVSFVTILYIFYDILFLEIHEWIMASGIWLAIIWLIINDFWFQILPTINNFWEVWFLQNIIAIILTLWIIFGFYLIMIKELDLKYDILIIFLSIFLLTIFLNYFWLGFWEIWIISWIIWALWIFIFFFLQIVLSGWKALWWGDLRIWIMIWLLLWISYSFAWIMITYLVWSIISIFIILVKYLKNKNKKINTQIPFWPFLWIWFFITIFFLDYIDKFITIYF